MSPLPYTHRHNFLLLHQYSDCLRKVKRNQIITLNYDIITAHHYHHHHHRVSLVLAVIPFHLTHSPQSGISTVFVPLIMPRSPAIQAFSIYRIAAKYNRLSASLNSSRTLTVVQLCNFNIMYNQHDFNIIQMLFT